MYSKWGIVIAILVIVGVFVYGAFKPAPIDGTENDYNLTTIVDDDGEVISDSVLSYGGQATQDTQDKGADIAEEEIPAQEQKHDFVETLEEQAAALDVIEVIVNRSWQLGYIVNESGVKETLPEQANFELTFNDEGRIIGRAGCNNFTGIYDVLEGHHLQITPNMATTKMACHPDVMDFESRFLAVLPAVNKMRVNQDGALELLMNETLLILLQEIPETAEDNEDNEDN